MSQYKKVLVWDFFIMFAQHGCREHSRSHTVRGAIKIRILGGKCETLQKQLFTSSGSIFVFSSLRFSISGNHRFIVIKTLVRVTLNMLGDKMDLSSCDPCRRHFLVSSPHKMFIYEGPSAQVFYLVADVCSKVLSWETKAIHSWFELKSQSQFCSRLNLPTKGNRVTCQRNHPDWDNTFL